MTLGVFDSRTFGAAKSHQKIVTVLTGVPMLNSGEWLAGPNRQLKDYLVEIGADSKWKEVEGVGHSYLGEYQEDLMDWFKENTK
jgi:enterochelin esterase-like enzyme